MKARKSIKRLACRALNTRKCANCQKVPKRMIIEIGKDYPWCARCWREYLEDDYTHRELSSLVAHLVLLAPKIKIARAARGENSLVRVP